MANVDSTENLDKEESKVDEATTEKIIDGDHDKFNKVFEVFDTEHP